MAGGGEALGRVSLGHAVGMVAESVLQTPAVLFSGERCAGQVMERLCERVLVAGRSGEHRHRMGPTLSQDLIRVVREGRRAEGRTGEVTEYGHEVFDREGSEAVDGVR